jgi:short-subunit dehydrogenase
VNRPLALITGGSTGIGHAIAERLAGRGWRLLLVARGRDRLAAAATVLGADHVVADVGSPDAPRRIRRFLDDAGVDRLDLLVCNAGMPGRGDGPSVDAAYARVVIDTNLHGMIGVTTAVWPLLCAAHGRVVNVCSVAGTVAVPDAAVYSASKHAAVAWSRSLAVSAARDGVGVLTVNPGPVATDGFPQTALLAHRLARRVVWTPQACADRIVAAVDNDHREIFIPAWWRIAAVAQALAPATVSRIAERLVVR